MHGQKMGRGAFTVLRFWSSSAVLRTGIPICPVPGPLRLSLSQGPKVSSTSMLLRKSCADVNQPKTQVECQFPNHHMHLCPCVEANVTQGLR